MKKMTTLMLFMTACCSDTVPERPTYRDAATEVAYGQCSRWIECGTETQQTWQECVDYLVHNFCNNLVLMPGGHRCLDPYEGDFDEVSRCAMWYGQVTCGQYVPACEL